MTLITHHRTDTRAVTEPTPPRAGGRSTWRTLGWVAVALALLATLVLAALVVWPNEESAQPAVDHPVSVRAVEGAQPDAVADPGSPSIRAIEGAQPDAVADPGSPSIRAIEGAQPDAVADPGSPSIRAIEGAEVSTSTTLPGSPSIRAIEGAAANNR